MVPRPVARTASNRRSRRPDHRRRHPLLRRAAVVSVTEILLVFTLCARKISIAILISNVQRNKVVMQDGFNLTRRDIFLLYLSYLIRVTAI